MKTEMEDRYRVVCSACGLDCEFTVPAGPWWEGQAALVLNTARMRHLDASRRCPTDDYVTITPLRRG